MKILLIVPLPPPITGDSLAAKVVHQALSGTQHEVKTVNLSKTSGNRILELLKGWLAAFKYKQDADVIYLNLAESFGGNVRDIIFYLICYSKLPQMIVHLHGGNNMRGKIMSNPILRPINLFFLRKLKGIIVLGNSQLSIYDDAALQPKLSVIPNFFEDALKLPTEAIQQKFLSPPPIKLLYLSNLIRDKGYYDLFEAFKNLTAVEQTQFELHFAGKLDPLNPQFVEEIRPFTNVHYHGIVQGEQKKNLLATCHIFCLPTYYYAEGQPISILEAYAAGCVVITTNHSGIRDIFSDKINGYEVSKQSPESIVNCLRSLLKNQNELVQIGVSNALHAQKNYTEKTFITNVFDVLLDTKI